MKSAAAWQRRPSRLAALQFCAVWLAAASALQFPPPPPTWLAPERLEKLHVNKTIILSNSNCGHADLSLNMGLSLLKLNITNFVIICEGPPSCAYLARGLGQQHVELTYIARGA